MTSVADCDIKYKEDLLSVMEMKNEPEDKERAVKIEAIEECDNIFEHVVKQEHESTTLHFPFKNTISEVERTLDKSLDDCEKNLQDEQNSTEGDKTDASFIHDLYETCGTDLQDQKYGDFVGKKANICTRCNGTNFLPDNPVTCKQIPCNCFKSNICNKSFPERLTLIRHVYSHTNEKPFKCKICSSSFSEKYGLSRHILRTHTNEKPFECNVCSKLFSNKSHLIRHMHTHTNEKPFKCNTCSRSFSDNYHLLEHIRTHTNEKLFECDICSKSFSQKSCLTLHIFTHTNEKPFKCNICSSSFSDKYDLTRHIRIHTNEKPFECNICSKSFSRKSSLSRHIHTHTMKNHKI